MGVQRVMGAETEFGVIAPTTPEANHTVLSATIVNTYNAMVFRTAQRAQWEYDSEQPLEDARGFAMQRELAHESQLTDEAYVLTSEDIAAEALRESGMYAERLDWDKVTMNSILPNGARLYVDHAHPEYSSPEVTNPFDAVLWDAAGDFIAAETVDALARSAQNTGVEPIHLYKNNTDGKGQSYGSHENYLVDRGVDFEYLTLVLAPFFATRIIYTGAGRVGLGASGEQAGFQISSRADFFERLVGLETTIRRPLVNTRDEPHADREKYRRLHVITGDANLSHTSNLLKFGTVALVLDAIEQKVAPVFRLADPVAAMHAVSRDLSMKAPVKLSDGSSTTAVEIQKTFLAVARQANPHPDEMTARVLTLWQEVLDALEQNPLSLADTLDWVAKYNLMRAYVNKGVSWDNPKMRAIDIQYSDVRPDKGLYFKLIALGKMKTLFTEEQIRQAAHQPPHDTRAYLRGKIVEIWQHEVVSASWDTIVTRNPLDIVTYRLTMDEPLSLTRAEIEPYLADESSEGLMRALGAHAVTH
ncbi:MULTISPECIES: depupylase/deamidase Dop [unclassified Rothia (in: high G+C Gram-positive bacteria)]|uniref:depupylase/deamidase Dop n=1 Tax=unclassified Rothia (in: high G+C Gram-positive bacteria) TaxID=2689056 RepID=UPI00195C9F44|nr:MULTISPECIES: depupylase/deamidase Dop [unclassified Rothia (in: high G+C Gram-positive bacteria)]MBM7050561.1 proteasome accessory factor PafA2 [Rothia sp. ZJ1223]QRZ60752.1 proteasome accessory factor PafA2 [Rothia sp. ZJ932]